MSESAETPEAGAANLRRAIAQLPTHEPSSEAWLRIEGHLAADAALAQQLLALPTHEPDEAVWGAIAGRLDALAPVPAPAGARPWRLASGRVRRRAWALAASLALLLAGGWWQWEYNINPAAPALRETLAFSEETVEGPLPASTTLAYADPLERQGEAFIDAHCSSLPAVCQSGEFRALRTQLTELETQETELRQAAQRFGQSPELLREQTRLITLKASITRELVHLLIS